MFDVLLRLEEGADAAGREAVGFFEDLREMVGIVEAGLFGGFFYAGLIILHQEEGAFDPFAVQHFGGGGVEFGPEQVVQMLG